VPRPRRPERADVEISASARARRLRVRKAPDVVERTVAEPGGETASGSDRENLPDEVQEGATYEDIRIDHRIASRLTGEGADAGESEGAAEDRGDSEDKDTGGEKREDDDSVR
jgi:hypothetical protein